MSWLSKAKDKVKKEVKRETRQISNLIPHTHSSERRAAMEATNEQIAYYKQEKEAAQEMRKNNENEKNEERKRISESQIKARKATYRRGGFLEEPNSGTKNQLG